MLECINKSAWALINKDIFLFFIQRLEKEIATHSLEP